MESPSNGRGTWYVILQIALLALIAFGPPGPIEQLEATAALTPVGISLIIGGALVLILGTLGLGRDLTPFPDARRTSRLVTTGVYGVVRHPLYAGLILSSLGWSIWQRGLWTLVYTTALAVLLDRKASREERDLQDKFADYADYRTRVSKLIPWLW